MRSEEWNERYLSDPRATANLRERSIRAGAVTVSAQGVKFVLRMGSTIVLARLLSPGDYGLVAIVTAIATMLNIFRDGGLSNAVIQRSEITHAEVSGSFWLNVALGAVVMLVLCAIAPVVAWAYGRPELWAIMTAFAGLALLGSLGIQHSALLQRRLEFKQLAIRDLAGLVAGVTAGVTSAVLGAGYWALVAMEGTSTVVAVVALWLGCPWRPSRPRSFRGLMPLVAFGANVTGGDLISRMTKNMDAICLGYLFNAQTVGLYNRAQNLMAQPMRQVMTPVFNVARPALARTAGSPRRFSRAVEELTGLTSFWGVLAVVCLLPPCDWIVVGLLGDQWVDCVPIFAALTPFALVEPTSYLLGTALIAYGNPGALLRWKAIDALVILVGLAIGLHWGAVGVACAFAGSGLLLRTPTFMWYVSRLTPVDLRPLLGTVAASIGVGLLAIAAGWAARPFVAGLAPLVAAGIVAAISAAAHLLLTAATPNGRRTLRHVQSIVETLAKRRRPAPVASSPGGGIGGLE